MINAIIEAIIAALNKEFGDAYEIHMEEIGQDLKRSCFFIQCVNSTNELFLGKRYLRTNQMCIQYFPGTAEPQRECNGVAERMCQCLEYIAVCGGDKPVRGAKMRYEVTDGVLNFFVNYDCFVRRAAQGEPMESLESNTTITQ